ncbi:MAG: hypothetical protein ACR2JQ_01240 [Mycobacteriales bacterium]
MTDQSSAAAVPGYAALNLRRAGVGAAVLGAVALGVSVAIRHPLGGVFVLLGLALGAANVRAVQRSVAAFATSSLGGKKAFVGGVFLRLGALTVVGLALAYFVQPDGIGVVIGLALFQLLMLGAASVPVLRELRRT